MSQRLFSIRSFVAIPQDIRDWTRFLENIQIVGLYSGVGSPEGKVIATVGSLYTRIDGGAGTTLYVKEANATAVGWVAK
ncbi:MAG TPA: hypothetical protein VK626_01550 [Nitrospiraceae bacterium]|nr:hypothetical protein [Nitrospiraceae bacterium]